MADDKTVFLDRIPEEHIHIAADGRRSARVSFLCFKSADGSASISVDVDQLRPAAKRDRPVATNCKDVLLGDPEQERTVSICTKMAEGNAPAEYASIRMANRDIAADRAAFFKALVSAVVAYCADYERAQAVPDGLVATFAYPSMAKAMHPPMPATRRRGGYFLP